MYFFNGIINEIYQNIQSKVNIKQASAKFYLTLFENDTHFSNIFFVTFFFKANF